MTAVHMGDRSATAVFGRIGAARILPVAMLDDAAAADPLAEALLGSGLDCVEVTVGTAAALDTITAISDRGDMLVGVGGVVTSAQVDRAVAAGARFVVSPGFSPAVVRHCQDLGVCVMPGIATATEIQMGLDAGLDTMSFFPADPLGGPSMVAALTAAFRGVRFVPAGGVASANLTGYLAIPSVLAVSGSWMVPPDLLAAGRWDEVTRRAAESLAAAGS